MLSGFNHIDLNLNFNLNNFLDKYELDDFQSEILESCNKVLYINCNIQVSEYSFRITSTAQKVTSNNYYGEESLDTYCLELYLPTLKDTETKFYIDTFAIFKLLIFKDVDNKWKYMLINIYAGDGA